MAHREYAQIDFIAALAQKARTPILLLQVEASCASSLRFRDIEGITDEMINNLGDDGTAFITFDSLDEAKKFHDGIVANFPRSGETTLGLTAILGLTNGQALVFDQQHGAERMLYTQ